MAKVKMQSEPGAQAFYGDAAAGHTPIDLREFARTCREARAAFSRVFVALHIFVGVSRQSDVVGHFRREAAAHAFDFFFCSVDLLTSADWDFSQPLRPFVSPHRGRSDQRGVGRTALLYMERSSLAPRRTATPQAQVDLQLGAVPASH